MLLGGEEKLMSKLYKCLLNWYTESETVKIQMIRWAEIFNRNIPYEIWEYFWNHALRISTCTRLRENSLKMMYR